MLRQVGLLDTQYLLDGARGNLAIAKDFHDGYAGGMGESMEDARLVVPQHGLHKIRIFDISNIRKCMQTTARPANGGSAASAHPPDRCPRFRAARLPGSCRA